MKKLFIRYRFFLITLLMLVVLALVNTGLALKSFSITAYSLREVLLVIPPIFVLLGLLDIWVPRHTMVRFMGHGSGVKGVLLAVLIGSAAAGPLYGAFPVAAVFLKRGASFRNVFIFIGAWSTTEIPMLLFEYEALGPRFALTRLLVDIPGIIVISWLLGLSLNDSDRLDIVRKVEKLTK
ncbi:MAG: permease [Spirochaetia bacterium]|nr:permease [Spirochaetia bacterium]